MVARAALDPNLDDNYKKVTGPGVEFWPIPFYLGPEQFLMRRRKIRKSLLAAVEEYDALLCRVPRRSQMNCCRSFGRRAGRTVLRWAGIPKRLSHPEPYGIRCDGFFDIIWRGCYSWNAPGPPPSPT